MQRARLFEILGSFLLGGGIVAVGYELAIGPSSSADPETVAGASVSEVVAQPPVYAGASPDGGENLGEPDPLADDGSRPDLPAHRQPNEQGSYSAFPPIFTETRPLDAAAELKYPRHGLVSARAVIVRTRADLKSPILGILRAGTRVRVDRERTFGGGCSQGWNRVHPRGWICRAAGLRVDDTPPDDGLVPSVAPKLEQPLPYEYLRVKDLMTPFFHRLPSFGEQDRADAAGRAWAQANGSTPMPTDPKARPSEVPGVVKEYMNPGYYVTKAGEEIKSKRRFVRTRRGVYARKYQLKVKTSPAFTGQLVTDPETLPLHFIRRELALLQREAEGSDVLIKTETVPKRLSTHNFQRKIHVGSHPYFEDDEGRLMRAYAVGEARRIKRPPGIERDEHWVHIDLSEQTLVAYQGDTPVFATLVSTGKEPGMTPVGIHRVQIKHVATSMRDQPPEDDAYSIEDVPWTQYFHGSVALHGAFWHAGFGQERSHGCVNLSPSDARWLFGFTRPQLPDGWHAAAPTRSDPGSAIVVTK